MKVRFENYNGKAMAKKRINWKFVQNNSQSVLASGLNKLIKSNKYSLDDQHITDPGNYFIFDTMKRWKYIGEAKNLSHRIKQHSKEQTSTFYKNYNRSRTHSYIVENQLLIKDFKVQTIETKIGRKELEEFGIVNLSVNLNKFQINKRTFFYGKSDESIWNEVQEMKLMLLEQAEVEVLKSKAYKWTEAIIPSKAGLYWVAHSKKGLIYIGESSNITDRYKTHSTKTYFSALRRHIGENILGYSLKIKNGKKRYFDESEERDVDNFLRHCSIIPYEVNFGRYELEEFLIRKYHPLLNRKDNL